MGAGRNPFSAGARYHRELNSARPALIPCLRPSLRHRSNNRKTHVLFSWRGRGSGAGILPKGIEGTAVHFFVPELDLRADESLVHALIGLRFRASGVCVVCLQDRLRLIWFEGDLLARPFINEPTIAYVDAVSPPAVYLAADMIRSLRHPLEPCRTGLVEGSRDGLPRRIFTATAERGQSQSEGQRRSRHESRRQKRKLATTLRLWRLNRSLLRLRFVPCAFRRMNGLETGTFAPPILTVEPSSSLRLV